MLISRAIYNRMISNFDSGSNALTKIVHFRKAKIISWALVEGGCFFALVASIITSNYLYIAVFILLFGFFITLRLSGESLIRDMRLNSEESDLILRK
jgi:energy-converting hydrogenase Eha subunit C